MSIVPTILVFSYGSNMLSRRIQARVPSARATVPGKLFGHKLTWYKKSADGSGKCDIEATGIATDFVFGVLFEIALSEKPNLDKAEGRGSGYEEKFVEIFTSLGAINATAYYGTNVDSSLAPYAWYKAFVIAGAREHQLPEHYLAALEAVPSIADPNEERRATNEALLDSAHPCPQSAPTPAALRAV